MEERPIAIDGDEANNKWITSYSGHLRAIIGGSWAVLVGEE
jgi:hypothetical protein